MADATVWLEIVSVLATFDIRAKDDAGMNMEVPTLYTDSLVRCVSDFCMLVSSSYFMGTIATRILSNVLLHLAQKGRRISFSKQWSHPLPEACYANAGLRSCNVLYRYFLLRYLPWLRISVAVSCVSRVSC